MWVFWFLEGLAILMLVEIMDCWLWFSALGFCILGLNCVGYFWHLGVWLILVCGMGWFGLCLGFVFLDVFSFGLVFWVCCGFCWLLCGWGLLVDALCFGFGFLVCRVGDICGFRVLVFCGFGILAFWFPYVFGVVCFGFSVAIDIYWFWLLFCVLYLFRFAGIGLGFGFACCGFDLVGFCLVCYVLCYLL